MARQFLLIFPRFFRNLQICCQVHRFACFSFPLYFLCIERLEVVFVFRYVLFGLLPCRLCSFQYFFVLFSISVWHSFCSEKCRNGLVLTAAKFSDPFLGFSGVSLWIQFFNGLFLLSFLEGIQLLKDVVIPGLISCDNCLYYLRSSAYFLSRCGGLNFITPSWNWLGGSLRNGFACKCLHWKGYKRYHGLRIVQVWVFFPVDSRRVVVCVRSRYSYTFFSKDQVMWYSS